MSFLPTPEIVAVSWIKTIPGVPTSAVATTLPGDNAAWATAGFVQVNNVGGSSSRASSSGTPGIYVPVRNPVLQIDCWANSPDSQKPPWGKAAVLAETVMKGCYDSSLQNKDVALPAAYSGVRVMAAYPLTEPRRIPEDEAGFARYQFDLLITWVSL